MVLEVAIFTAKDGHTDQFVAAYAEARQFLEASPGCRSVRMTQGIEAPERFVLLVEWDSLEDHLDGFRTSDRFTQWRAVLGPHFDAADVQHAVDV